MSLVEASQIGFSFLSTYYLSPLATLGISECDFFETTSARVNEYIGSLLIWCKEILV